jgi:predicted O-methyltransferase YrrM
MLAPKTVITPELYQYALNIGTREKQILADLRQTTAKLPETVQQSTIDQSQLITLFAHIINARKYLEIGVLFGYNLLNMALTMPEDSLIFALENNDKCLTLARKFWRQAQVEHKIEVMQQDALSSCASLINEGKSGFFDMAFIDANKSAYIQYYEYCLQLVRSGGLIIIDNVLFHGEVLYTNPEKTFVHQIQQLNQLIHNDNRVEMVLLPIADGLTIVYKK